MTRWLVMFHDGTEHLMAPDDADEEAVLETLYQMHPTRGVMRVEVDPIAPLPPVTMSGARAAMHVRDGKSVRRQCWAPEWFVCKILSGAIYECRLYVTRFTGAPTLQAQEQIFNTDRFHDGDDWVVCDPVEMAAALVKA